MEYIDGEDLSSLLRRIGRLPAPKALEIARQMCAGLAAAHDRGVLHRDLKPANVMIDGRGHARITDFGLAVEAGPATSPADTSGTVSYMAPERFAGKPATVQSDLYALGLILYETYTGKPAFTGSTVRDWKRAHAESTPTNPSAIVTDIEPAVERAIMRCLEKDPARRPSSAAQVAAALPGGDPLAAAIAAGETPSPELVAASGEEGTLPRAKAWRWFATCLAALALALPLASLGSLANLVPARDPLLQQETARQLLRDIGYAGKPADSSWWYRTDQDYMRRLLEVTPARLRFSPAPTPLQSALVFSYRQSPMSLFALSPAGFVSVLQPVPLLPDDATVELNPDGGLRTFRAGGIDFGWARTGRAGSVPWPRLFAAAGLNQDAFKETAPRWTPVFAYDVKVAWEGTIEGEAIRVEGAAYRGRPVEFRVLPASREPAPPDSAEVGVPDRLADAAFVCLYLATLVVCAVLARRNARQGRGDRKGALRVALVTFAAEVTVQLLSRHWTPEPLAFMFVITYLLGPAFFMALMTGLFYLGLEPFVRRRWPHLLIAWTRLLEGRWRDPLVGRSLLVGTTAALVGLAVVPGLAVLATRTFSLPLAMPATWAQLGPAPVALAGLLADHWTSMLGVTEALFYLVILLIARLVTRNDRAAWAVMFVTCVGGTAWILALTQPSLSIASIETLVVAVAVAAVVVGVLNRHGLLACVVAVTVGVAILDTPFTLDMSRWYAWRTLVFAAIIIGLAGWGFRNVLGRQTAFPGGETEE